MAVGTAVATARASVVIVGGHEAGAGVAVDPLVEHGPLLRAASAWKGLDAAVHEALDITDLPVCVVPMTLGRDPLLVADTARALKALAGGTAAGRVMLAEPFGNATLLAGWLRVAVAGVAKQHRGTDLAVLVTANAANRFDDAELCRIAHLVRARKDIPWLEVAFRGGDPDPAEGVKRCGQLGARRVAVVPADFGPGLDTPIPGVVDGRALLTPSAISGMLATRVARAMLRLRHADDGIAAGLRAGRGRGQGGEPWQDPDSDAR